MGESVSEVKGQLMQLSLNWELCFKSAENSLLLPLFPGQKGTVLQSLFIVSLISRHFRFLTLCKMSFRNFSQRHGLSSWNIRPDPGWLAKFSHHYKMSYLCKLLALEREKVASKWAVLQTQSKCSELWGKLTWHAPEQPVEHNFVLLCVTPCFHFANAGC